MRAQSKFKPHMNNKLICILIFEYHHKIWAKQCGAEQKKSFRFSNFSQKFILLVFVNKIPLVFHKSQFCISKATKESPFEGIEATLRLDNCYYAIRVEEKRFFVHLKISSNGKKKHLKNPKKRVHNISDARMCIGSTKRFVLMTLYQ